SRIGGSGPVSSIVKSSIRCAATAASRCSTVWIVALPWPIAVRRSTASTSVSRAGTSGFPARSTRRNTMPCPDNAGRNVASVAACRLAEVGCCSGIIGDRPGRDERPGAASDGEMIRNALLPRDDYVVLHLHAPRDAGLRHDEAARADAHVMGDVDEIVDLGAR